MLKNDRKKISILLLEENPQVVSRFKQSLADKDQFTAIIDYAFDLKEAQQKLSERTYHLVVADSELETGSGFTLFDDMKSMGLSLPFILMTPIHDDVLARKALKAGVADVFISSEEEYQSLAERLQECIENFRRQKDKPKRKKRSQKKKEELQKELPSLEECQSVVSEDTKERDELTGLYTHSYLHERLVREFSRAVRYQYPISCLMLDIDHFKSINEENGYSIGDQVLKESAKILFDNCRLSDLIARFGGEEFAVILPHIDNDAALLLAKRLRVIFAEKLFPSGDGEVNVTISIGISSFPQDPIKFRAELLTFAEKAMQHSKALGRNRVTQFCDLAPTFNESFPNIKIDENKIVQFQRSLTDIADSARKSYVEASKALIFALESKDSFTAGHSASCANYAFKLAEAMGLSVDEAEVVKHGALLHDIGKLCISDDILLKPGRLTLEEFEKMKQHAYMGYKILKPIKFLKEESKIVLHHHEWFNGEGYPSRLKGNDIPLGARIVGVVDSYDTMRNAGKRYKKVSDVEKTVNELINCAGTQFDPRVVKAFIEVLRMRGELRTDNYDSRRLEAAIFTLQKDNQ